MTLTWEEIKAKPLGAILHDEFRDGLRFIIMRGPASLTAYIGVPDGHPLAGHSYEDLPVEAHGSLTFGDEGGGKWPTGWFWYGWAYNHAGDYTFFSDELPLLERGSRHQDEHKWLVEEVIKDGWRTQYDMQRLVRLAEAIRNKFLVQG